MLTLYYSTFSITGILEYSIFLFKLYNGINTVFPHF